MVGQEAIRQALETTDLSKTQKRKKFRSLEIDCCYIIFVGSWSSSIDDSRFKTSNHLGDWKGDFEHLTVGNDSIKALRVEHSIKGSLECGRSCNAKAAAVVGEVLAMRLKVDGLEQGQGRGIHMDINKETEKKGFKNRTKIWAIVNSLKNNGVKLILDNNDDDASRPSYE
ncbi:hypothetical protein SDJN03_29725, partial [Cucurbita argyrosperma subsp. sororia]